jgi:methenyltetrahydromethanopterin cyclohydrolase
MSSSSKSFIHTGLSLPTAKLSVNKEARKLLNELIEHADKYGVAVKKTKEGATLIDAGIKAKGGFQAGKIITAICLGGLANVSIHLAYYEDTILPSILVRTDHPAIATMGSQFADWQVKHDDFNAIGSGPARALARMNSRLYQKIGYMDKADTTVILLETETEPPEAIIKEIANKCKVSVIGLSLIVAPTTSIAGSTQVSGRIVETGVHKLMKLGIDSKKVTTAIGTAPIAPAHPKFIVAMGRTNDAILYAGRAHYNVTGYSDEELKQIVKKAPSSASRHYGRPFQQIFKEANYDFYKIDPNLFAPAMVSVCNLDTGSLFEAGTANLEVFKRSIGLRVS